MKIWVFRYTQKKFVKKLANSWALWGDCLFILTARLNWLFSERSSSVTFNTVQPSGITVLLQMLDAWKRFRALKCVYSNHTASYESLLNKARLPSLEVGRQMNIAIQTFKILNDLSPTYLLELIKKRCRTRNIRNSENILKIPLMKRVRHGTNSFCFLAPKIWNPLPEALRITRDLKTSRDGLRAYFSFQLRVQ